MRLCYRNRPRKQWPLEWSEGYSSILNWYLRQCIFVHVTYSQMHNILSKRHYRTYCKPPWHISPQIGEKLPAACPRMSCNGELDEWAHHYSQLQVDFHWPIWIWILRDYILDVMLTVCYQLSLQINDVKLILLSEQHENLTKIFEELSTQCVGIHNSNMDTKAKSRQADACLYYHYAYRPGVRGNDSLSQPQSAKSSRHKSQLVLAEQWLEFTMTASFCDLTLTWAVLWLAST